VPGVGKKTAQRLVMELRDALEAPASGDLPVGDGAAAAGEAAAASGGPRREAVAALQELGYSADQADKAVAAVGDDDLPVEEILKRCLQRMAR